MKQTLTLTVAACVLATLTFVSSGCQNTKANSSTGTHRMGTPKENYQMSNEDMPNYRGKSRHSDPTSSSGGTHRMGTPKENYQMSNEDMPARRN